MKKSWTAGAAALLLLPVSPIKAQAPSTPKDADNHQPQATLTTKVCDGKHLGTGHWNVTMPNKDVIQLDAKRGGFGVYDVTYTVPAEYKSKTPGEAMAIEQSVMTAAGPSYYEAEKACGTAAPIPPQYNFPPKVVFAEASKK